MTLNNSFQIIFLCLVGAVLALRQNEDVLSIYYDYEINQINDYEFNDNSLWDSVDLLSLGHHQYVKKKCLKLSVTSEIYCLCQLKGSISKYECKTSPSAHINDNNLFEMKMRNEYYEMSPTQLTVVPLQMDADPVGEQDVDTDTTSTINTFKGQIAAKFNNQAVAPLVAQQHLLTIYTNPGFDSAKKVTKTNWQYHFNWLKDGTVGDAELGPKIYIAGTRASIGHHIYNNALENTLKTINDDVLRGIDSIVDHDKKDAKKKIWNDYLDTFKYDLGGGLASFHTCLNHFVFNVGQVVGGDQAKDGLVSIPLAGEVANGGVSKPELAYLLHDENKSGFEDLQTVIYGAVRMFMGDRMKVRHQADYDTLHNAIVNVFNAKSEQETITTNAQKTYNLPAWCDGPVARFEIEEMWKVTRSMATIKQEYAKSEHGDTTKGEQEFYHLSHFGGHIMWRFNKMPRILKRIFGVTKEIKASAEGSSQDAEFIQ